jgi:hypothetical protein
MTAPRASGVPRPDAARSERSVHSERRSARIAELEIVKEYKNSWLRIPANR